MYFLQFLLQLQEKIHGTPVFVMCLKNIVY